MVEISVVVPLYNEADNIELLYSRLIEVLIKINKEYELIFIDDGSFDRTSSILKKIFDNDYKIVVIRMSRNHGQTYALAAGFQFTKGDIVITMDGDLQHDPEDIPILIDKINEGYDVVSGWRKKRLDSFFTRRLPSLIANRIIGLLSGVKLHDFGTTFKAYRRKVIKDIELFGELHRFIPALISEKGFSITEVPIKNTLRTKGKSNYGLSRVITVFLDFILIKYLIKHSYSPLHYFGKFGIIIFSLGSIIGIFLMVEKIIFKVQIMAVHGPLLMLSILFIITSTQFIFFGLLAEMLTRINHGLSNKKAYSIAEIMQHQETQI